MTTEHDLAELEKAWDGIERRTEEAPLDGLMDAFEGAVTLAQHLAQIILQRDGHLPSHINPAVASLHTIVSEGSIGYTIELYPPDDDAKLPEHCSLTLYDRGIHAQRVLWSTQGDSVDELANAAVEWLKTQRAAVVDV